MDVQSAADVAASLLALGAFVYGAARVAAARGLGPLRDALRDVQHQVAGLTGFANLLGRLLAAQKLLSPEGAIELAQSYNAAWREEVARERESLNPLTAAELERFERYRVKLLEQRRMLAPDEVRDYRALTKRLYDDRPQDPTLPLLLGLGLLLAALVPDPLSEQEQGGAGSPDPPR